MANENATASANGHDPVPHETAPFVIGGRTIDVPALNLEILLEKRDEIRSLDGDMSVIEYAKVVIDLVAALRPDLDAKMLRQECSFIEARNLIGAWSELLRVSGFGLGEPEAASPGTGTSTSSSPNSEPAASAAATPIG